MQQAFSLKFICEFSDKFLSLRPAFVSFRKKENKKKDTLTDSMMMFLILNTASIQIIPTTVIAIRNSMGSSNPTAIVFPVWIATIVAAIFRNYCNKSIN